MRRSDLVSGSLLLIFGLVMIFIIVPYQINSSSDYGLDPSFFPLSLLWLLTVMAVLLVATRVHATRNADDAEPVLDAHNWMFIGGFAAFLLVVFLAIKSLGFVIGGALLIAALMFALGYRHMKWIELVGVSALAPVIIYYSLYHIFSVQLPSGAVFP